MKIVSHPQTDISPAADDICWTPADTQADAAQDDDGRIPIFDFACNTLRDLEYTREQRAELFDLVRLNLEAVDANRRTVRKLREASRLRAVVVAGLQADIARLTADNAALQADNATLTNYVGWLESQLLEPRPLALQAGSHAPRPTDCLEGATT